MESTNIGRYAREVLRKPLYEYQEEIANAILDSIFGKKGLTISVMLSRQAGKNQISAILEAYLLTCVDSGTIIKVAPT